MICKHCNKRKEEHQLVQHGEGIIKLHCICNRQVMLKYEFEEFIKPKKYDAGIGYFFTIDNNGWVDYGCGIVKQTLVNSEKDLKLLQTIINESKQLFKNKKFVEVSKSESEEKGE